MAGRKRKPRSLRLLEGNRGKRKVPTEPSYAAELPAPPSYLAGIGLEEWHKLDRALDRVGKQLMKAVSELGLSPVTKEQGVTRNTEGGGPVR